MTNSELFTQLQQDLCERSAAFVACGDVQPLPQDIRHGLPRAVSIGVSLDPQIVAGIADGPTLEYAAEYERVNALLGRLARRCAAFLQEHGFRARAGEATVAKLDYQTLATPLPHKTAATRSGVGWIGKSALLITRQFGAAVRLATVLTDAPLPRGTPVEASQCGKCTECVDACPAGAPSGRHWRADLSRADFFDAFACCRCAEALAGEQGIEHAICGICVAACPYTKRFLQRDGSTDAHPAAR